LDKTYRSCLRVNFESNDSYEPVYRPAEKHMAFRPPQFLSTVSLHSSERVTIALGYPKSLEPFQRLRGFFRMTSSLAYWNLRWTILKPQRYKRLISDIQRTELFSLLSAASAKAFDDRDSSIILCTWFSKQHRGYFENMIVY